MNYKSFIKTVLNQAQEKALAFYKKDLNVSIKDDINQVVSDVDITIGKLIISSIRSEYPSHSIIDEEQAFIDNNSNFIWVIDPIDGSSNYVQGLPHFGIMIGLLEDFKPIAGGIALPFYKEIYVSQQGSGTFLNEQKIKLSNKKVLRNSLLAYGIDGYPDKPSKTNKELKLLKKLILNIRNLRTTNSAYDMAKTVSGEYGAFINQTTKIWDNVALHSLIVEAGGKFTNLKGNNPDYSNIIKDINSNFTVCASSKKIHSEIMKIVHE